MKRAIAAAVLALGLGLFTASAAQAEPDDAITPDGALGLSQLDTKKLTDWQICGVDVANSSMAPRCDSNDVTGVGEAFADDI